MSLIPFDQYVVCVCLSVFEKTGPFLILLLPPLSVSYLCLGSSAEGFPAFSPVT